MLALITAGICSSNNRIATGAYCCDTLQTVDSSHRDNVLLSWDKTSDVGLEYPPNSDAGGGAS